MSAHGFTQALVQSTWTEEEDEELLQHLYSLQEQQGLQVRVIPEADLRMTAIDPKTMVFADSSLVQGMLPAAVVVETYPACLRHLYHRRIWRARLSRMRVLANEDGGEKGRRGSGHVAAILTVRLPCFIKPAHGHKRFAARMLRSVADLQDLQEEVGDDGGVEVYVSDPSDFVCEYRLFLSDGRVWATRDYSEHMLPHRSQSAVQGEPVVVEEETIPEAFVTEVAKAVAGVGFVVVDVGLTLDGQWCVVEANPPFALSSYGLDIAVYVEYCCAAWLSLVRASVTAGNQTVGQHHHSKMEIPLQDRQDHGHLRVIATPGALQSYVTPQQQVALVRKLKARRYRLAQAPLGVVAAQLADEQHGMAATALRNRVSGVTLYVNATHVDGKVPREDFSAMKAARVAGAKAWRALLQCDRDNWNDKARQHNEQLLQK